MADILFIPVFRKTATVILLDANFLTTLKIISGMGMNSSAGNHTVFSISEIFNVVSKVCCLSVKVKEICLP